MPMMGISEIKILLCAQKECDEAFATIEKLKQGIIENRGLNLLI